MVVHTHRGAAGAGKGYAMRSLLAAVLLLGLSFRATANPPFELVIMEMVEAIYELEAGEIADWDAYLAGVAAIRVKAIEQIDIESLTLEQFETMLRRRLVYVKEPPLDNVDRFVAALTQRADDHSEDGAYALLLIARAEALKGGPRGAEASLRAIEHPQAAALLRNQRGGLVWLRCQWAVGARDRVRALNSIASLLDRVPDDFDPSNLSDIDALYDTLARDQDPRARELGETFRTRMLEAGRARVDALELNEKDRWWPELRLAFLEHAPARMNLLGSDAPDFDFLWWSDDDRPAQRLSDLRGEVVVLEFWSSDCGFCYDAFDKLAPIVEHYKGRPVRFVSLSERNGYVVTDYDAEEYEDTPDIRDEADATRRLINRLGHSWTFAIANELDFAPQLGVRGVPGMMILDHRGVVRGLGHDPRQPREKTLGLLDSLLAEREGDRAVAPRAASPGDDGSGGPETRPED
ncbi:MAG: TlpA family protein disulfide reductase [Phycisphaeraceae bacterium]|nr:TlpA family protein disulfide reductase [Phycisphaeraceae bacterium]